MPTDGWRNGIVVQPVDLVSSRPYVTIKATLGGAEMRFGDAETIETLGLGKKANKKVQFKYKSRKEAGKRVIEDVRLNHISDSASKSAPKQLDFRFGTPPISSPLSYDGSGIRGVVTRIKENKNYLVIRVCESGKKAYQRDAYDTVTKWRLEENSIIRFRCSLNEPPELLEVLGVEPCSGA